LLHGLDCGDAVVSVEASVTCGVVNMRKIRLMSLHGSSSTAPMVPTLYPELRLMERPIYKSHSGFIDKASFGQLIFTPFPVAMPEATPSP
jgi:hypothetical protein